MDSIDARKVAALSLLSRSYDQKAPLESDADYALFARSAVQAGASPLGDTINPEVLTRIILDGCAFVATNDDEKIGYAARRHPLNHLPEVPAFISSSVSLRDIQFANESMFGQSPLIEVALPDSRTDLSIETPSDLFQLSADKDDILLYALHSANYPAPVPPQFDPSVVDRGIKRDNISTAYYLSPGQIYELITESTTVVNTQAEPLYLRLSPRLQPPHIPISRSLDSTPD